MLAAALKGKTTFLLTFDRKHFMVPTVLEAGLPFSIMTPGDFLRYLRMSPLRGEPFPRCFTRRRQGAVGLASPYPEAAPMGAW